MEDTQSTPQASEPGAESQPKSQEQPGQELLDELTQLADRFANVVKVAWNSEQRKQIEADVKTGLSSLATSMEAGFKQVASSSEAKELQAKATEVGGKVGSTKFVADLADALKTGLRALSDQLDKLSAEMQEKRAAPGTGASDETATGSTESPDASGADVKDIPISKM